MKAAGLWDWRCITNEEKYPERTGLTSPSVLKKSKRWSINNLGAGAVLVSVSTSVVASEMASDAEVSRTFFSVEDTSV